MQFEELDLDYRLAATIADSGYTDMTPIQEATLAKALVGRDILGIARTGTGKTAAYLIPTLNALNFGTTKARMPRALILVPTRELAIQVQKYFERLSAGSNHTSTLLVGGTRYQEQSSDLQRGVDVLIATPGRLIDHIERQNVILHGVQVLVVDEADRMLEEGFMPQVEHIVRLTPFTRQSMLFSATMDRAIERVGREYLHNPLVVEVSPRATVSTQIDQCIYVVESGQSSEEFDFKRVLLRKVLTERGEDITNAIIFCNRKVHVDIVQQSLSVHKFNSEAIHGDMHQSVRTAVMDRFRSGDFKLLIASDVASRGLDIPTVSHVINFDVPVNPEDYIHRIGRTGRAGNTGMSITLCGQGELRSLGAVEKLIGHELPRRSWKAPASEVKRLRRRKSYARKRRRPQSFRSSAGKPARRRRGQRRQHGAPQPNQQSTG